MKRCNECANGVQDTDKVCTACRLADWTDQQDQARMARERLYALTAHREAYRARQIMQRDAIKAGVIMALAFLMLIALVAAAKDAMHYDLVTKPAMLKAHGVK